jgi:(p)ppGpp synthase/HD superfamily hydrolase
MVVAVLHDVIEDSHATLEDLRYAGFNETVVEAVDAITKREGERHKLGLGGQATPYWKYLKRIRANPIASLVKLADIYDNTEPRRLMGLKPHRRRRFLEKCDLAVQVILGIGFNRDLLRRYIEFYTL